MVLANPVPFSELKYGDWFITDDGHTGVSLKNKYTESLEAHFVFNADFRSIQCMSHNPMVQKLHNIRVTYDVIQKISHQVFVGN